MKENPRQQFRWAPHTCGATQIKPKDYEPGETVEAGGFYDAWTLLKQGARPLEVGDVLEAESGELRICKYVGFEQAQWVVPELRVGPDGVTAPAGAGDAPPPTTPNPALPG